MGEAFIVRRGGVSSEETAAPTITIISETDTGVTFTLKNNDDNTALITHEVDDNIGAVELAAAATSSNITVALAAGTYTLSAFATVVGEVASSATASVEIVVPEYELLFDSMTADDGNPIALPRTEIDITGLSIGKADTLRMVYTFVGDSTSANASYSLFNNNNNTATNYHSQNLVGAGTFIGANRGNSNRLAFARSTEKTQGFADIKVSNNDRFVYQSQHLIKVGSQSASVEQHNFNNAGTQTFTSITSLKIVSNRTNGIAAGSKIALYKVTEAA